MGDISATSREWRVASRECSASVVSILPSPLAPRRSPGRARRRGTTRSNRRGATIVELAIVLLLFLILVLGMLDLGIGVFRRQTLAQAARQGARQAIVHGALADRPEFGYVPWGPGTLTETADVGAHPVVEKIRPYLAGFDLSEVTIQAEWLDGDHRFEDRVRVTVSAPYRPMMTFIFGNLEITLQGTSTMAVAH